MQPQGNGSTDSGILGLHITIINDTLVDAHLTGF